MADMTFNTPSGQTIDRKLMLCFGNTATYASPSWHVMGKRVEDSSMEFDWGEESKKDIIGNTYANMKAPIVTQSFEPCELDSEDEYQVKLWNLAVKDQDAAALANQDLLVVHLYAGDETSGFFAERYPSSLVKPASLGGEGGGNLTMPVDVTFGGARETGTVTMNNGVPTYTKA